MARLGTLDGRLVLVGDDGISDVHDASEGRLPADTQEAFERWDEVAAWLASGPQPETTPVPAGARWGTPSPGARQILAVGVNSRTKLGQFGLGAPTDVGYIAKLHSALATADAPITRFSDEIYAETELAIVIGRRAWRIGEAEAPSVIAGISVAIDLADATSFVTIPGEGDRADIVYHDPAKSLPGFAPVGPHLVTLDEVGDLDDLRLSLEIDGRVVQDGTTADFVFSATQIVSRLSHRVVLLPGDIILTGSPGQVESSPLAPLGTGSTVVARIDGVGVQQHIVVDADDGRAFH